MRNLLRAPSPKRGVRGTHRHHSSIKPVAYEVMKVATIEGILQDRDRDCQAQIACVAELKALEEGAHAGSKGRRKRVMKL